MSNISLHCVDQNLLFLEKPTIYSGDVNYDTVTFSFDELWDGFTKTAIFYRTKEEPYYQLLDNNNVCTIPKEVLQDKGTIYIGVFGVMDDKVVTSQVLRYKIEEGAITEDLVKPDPTPDIFTQLLSASNDVVKTYEEYVVTVDKKVEDVIETLKDLGDIDGGKP